VCLGFCSSIQHQQQLFHAIHFAFAQVTGRMWMNGFEAIFRAIRRKPSSINTFVVTLYGQAAELAYVLQN
jgi:hypothetical protein